MVDYSKWDKLQVVDSSDEEELLVKQFSRIQSFDKQSPGYLISIPWDTASEMMRWALDLHRIPYIDKMVPWGWHYYEAAEFSDGTTPHNRLPVYVSYQKEILKKSNEELLLFLYSKAFQTVRIYPNEESLDLQMYFDADLAPAARLIFLNTCLSRSQLYKKYLVDNVHLNTWKTLNRLFFPLLKYWMKWHYKIDSKAIKQAWIQIDCVFNKVDEILKKRGSSRHYLVGETFTAADLAFASHAIHVLFINSVDDAFGDKIYISTPHLQELPLEIRTKVEQLRSHPAGQYALRIHKKEHTTSYRRLSSRYASENNPWWSDETTLTLLLVSGGTSFLLCTLIFAHCLTFHQFVAVYAGILGIVFILFYMLLKQTSVGQRLVKVALSK